MVIRVGVNILQSLFGLSSLSHANVTNKVRDIFLRSLHSSFIIVSLSILHVYACVYVDVYACEYTTHDFIKLVSYFLIIF